MTGSLRLWHVSLVSLVALVAACGAEEGTAGGGGGESSGAGGRGAEPSGAGVSSEAALAAPEVSAVAEEEAGASLASLCEFFQPCDCAAYEFVTLAACEAHFQSEAEAAIEEAEGLSYDGNCVGQVKAGFEAAGCITLSEGLSSLAKVRAIGQIAGCKMYFGEQAEGESCTALTRSNGDDCAAGLVCEAGSCQAAPRAAAVAEACRETEDCQAGLVCVPTGDTGFCTAAPVAGEECLFGLFCDLDATCEQGDCVALPAEGEACAAVPNLATQAACAPGLGCVDELCTGLPGPGDTCTPVSTFGRQACALGSACEGGACAAEEPAICAGGPFPLFP